MRANASTITVLLCLVLSLGVSEGVFRVKLFPYIPGTPEQLTNLAARLAQAFNRSPWGRARPINDLVIDLNPNDDLFNMGTLRRLFTGAEAYDIVEVDTLLLPSIVRQRWALALPDLDDRDWLPTVPNAVRVGRTTYGVPTYICSNVVFSFENLKGVRDSRSLIQQLGRRGVLRESESLLSANWRGSWTLPGAYVDAFVDTRSISRLPATLTSTELDRDTVTAFKHIVDACATTIDGVVVNPSLDGTYKGNTRAQQTFAAGAARGYVGYTENLYDVLVEARTLPGRNSWGMERLQDLHVIAAPLGAGSRPVMNVDALVLNSQLAQDAEKLKDAEAFARFLASPEARRLIAFGEDMGAGHPPRYLMQASAAFWELDEVRSDPVFSQLKAQFVDNSRAVAVPNTLFADDRIRTGVNDRLLRELTAPSSGDEERERDSDL